MSATLNCILPWGLTWARIIPLESRFRLLPKCRLRFMIGLLTVFLLGMGGQTICRASLPVSPQKSMPNAFCAAIILAAGASTRLGQPKQLLTIEDESLLRRTSRLALEGSFSPVVVVLGSHPEQ